MPCFIVEFVLLENAEGGCISTGVFVGVFFAEFLVLLFTHVVLAVAIYFYMKKKRCESCAFLHFILL